MKTSDEKHLYLLQTLVHNNPGIHPRNGTGEINYDVVDITPESKLFPQIIRMRIVDGWFFANVYITVQSDLAYQRQIEETLKLSKKDIREAFKKAKVLATINMAEIKANKKKRRQETIDKAIDNALTDEIV